MKTNTKLAAAILLSIAPLSACQAEEGLFERRLEAARVTVCATDTLAPIILVEGGVELPSGIPAWPLLEAPPGPERGCYTFVATHDEAEDPDFHYAEGELQVMWKEDGTVGSLVYGFRIVDAVNDTEYLLGDVVDTIVWSDDGRRYLVESLLSYDSQGMERRYEIGFTRNSPDSSDDPSTLMRITQETDRATVIVDLDYRTQEEN